MNLKIQKFNWVSSSDKNNIGLLEELNNCMIDFYSNTVSRDSYQNMLDKNDNDLESPGEATNSFIDYLKTIPNDSILEAGCGSGRLYQFIQKYLPRLSYTGIELSDKVVNSNKKRFPEASWIVGNTYKIPALTESRDIVFSFYVLEHLVFPERAIIEMLRVLKKGGYLILIFPDFVSSGRFASQKTGLTDDGTTSQKIKKGKLIDALISLYDNRFRLPAALSKAVKKSGSFPVNLNPRCLNIDCLAMSPDIDAVYVASKKEIKEWALKNGHIVFSPAGDCGYFSEHAFLSIKKEN